MPKTVDQGFRDFLTRLTPTSSESLGAQRHRESIKNCLERNFGLLGFFRTGSFGNGTSISGYSDVDYFAYLPSDRISVFSSNALIQVRDSLNTRFPRSGARVNCPAVKVPFGTDAKESTEVVPAKYDSRTRSGHTIYKIPDGASGWMCSSPKVHNNYVTAVDQRLGGKVKPLIRFIKAWKYYRQVPISSFYLELRVTQYAEGETVIIYDTDVRGVLAQLSSHGIARMQDPKGISGYISPCATDAQLEIARSKLSTALARANEAIEAKQKGNIAEAFSWWNLLYDNKFPNYY